MASLYIIHSLKINKFYVGITTEKVSVRVEKHNKATYGVRYTSIANDWILKLEIECQSFSIARKMELYIKRMKSSVFIRKLIDNPAEVEKLKQTIQGS